MVEGLINKEERKSDSYIWGIIIFLYILSTVEVYSAIGRKIGDDVFFPIFKHMIHLFCGFVITYVVSYFPLKLFKKVTLIMVPAAIVVLVLTLLIGENLNDAQRNIKFLGFSLQGAEIAKVTIVLSMAMVLAKTQIRQGVNRTGIIIVVALVTLFSGLLIFQGLTNAILFLGISVSMMLIGGVEFRKFLIIVPIYILLGLIGLGGKVAYDTLTDSSHPQTEQVVAANGAASTQELDKKENDLWSLLRVDTWKSRWDDFRDPKPEWEKPTDDGNKQKHRAAMAMAHGGLIGVGPGNSRESSELPLAFSDFIYAIIIEELGLIGGIVVLGAYLAILIRAGLIARRCNRAYPALLAMGMATMIVLQALFNMAIVVGVFPVSGQTLPLVSQGGSSIFMMSFAFGVILSVSRYAVKDTGAVIKTERENDLPEDLQAKNPTELA